MTTLEILKAARALIADPARWQRQDFADTWVCDPNASKFCAIGAAYHVAGVRPTSDEQTQEIRVAHDTLYGAAHELYGRGIIDVNDNIGHAAVMRCYDAAIAKLGG
jgi:hypothetical protein